MLYILLCRKSKILQFLCNYKFISLFYLNLKSTDLFYLSLSSMILVGEGSIILILGDMILNLMSFGGIQ